jgi:hypothetical protein
MWERPSADPGRSPKLCPHLEPAAQLTEVPGDAPLEPSGIDLAAFNLFFNHLHGVRIGE